jgi:dTDP-4-dehydrorhamnose 3,5-epimerase
MATFSVKETEIADVKLITPCVFSDERGYFMETYNRQVLKSVGIDSDFCQDNESCSMKGVLRGLHYQVAPYTQAKLVRVVRGSVFDVAVDIRTGSPTFGKYAAAILTAENKHQLYIPRGFAHGLLVLEDHTIFCYKCDSLYSPLAERGICFNDPVIGIAWPDVGIPFILSEKDRKNVILNETFTFYNQA